MGNYIHIVDWKEACNLQSNDKMKNYISECKEEGKHVYMDEPVQIFIGSQCLHGTYIDS